MSSRNSIRAVVFGALTLITAQPAQSAGPEASRIGTEIKGMSLGGSRSLTFGWRYMSFESDKFFLGGAAYTGQIGQGGGTLTYGGFVAGQKSRLGAGVESSFQLLAGALSTMVTGGTADGGLVLEPSLNLGFILGPSVRAVLNGGYAWTPGGTAASGVSYGLRFEFSMSAPPAPAPLPIQPSPAPTAAGRAQ